MNDLDTVMIEYTGTDACERAIIRAIGLMPNMQPGEWATRRGDHIRVLTRRDVLREFPEAIT